MNILIIINAIILITISLLHFYWGFGGDYGKLTTLPSRTNGQLLFKPGVFSTLVVAGGLLIFACITLGNLPLFDKWVNEKYIRYGSMAIAVIFIVRAIGDFKYVGFAKRITNTPFARNDSRLYSPLSFLIGVISLLIVMLKES